MHLFCMFLRVWSAKPEDPNLSPMADDAITQVGIRGLGFSMNICGSAITVMFVKGERLT